MAAGQKTVTLYHGTGNIFDGPPTSGGKDITGAGFPSATHDIGLAEFFAGGSRNGRIFSVRVPVSAILNLSEAPTKTAKDMRELVRQVREADADGKYQAVAIPGITTGDAYEFRILSLLPPSKWKVRPSEESKENYRPVENVISRTNAGEDVGNEEYLVAEQMLEEDLGETRRQVAVSEHDEDLVDFHQNQAKELEKRTLELKELQEKRREIRAGSTGDISTTESTGDISTTENTGDTSTAVAEDKTDMDNNAYGEELMEFHQNLTEDLEKRTLELKELQQRRREIKAGSTGDISTAIAEYKNAERPNNSGRGTPTTAVAKRVFTDRVPKRAVRAIRTGRGKKGMMS